MSESTDAAAVVVGAGFFGVNVALHLARRLKRRVVLLEREASILSRASRINQARVHGGYHYPRSLVTGYASQRRLRTFCDIWGSSVLSPREMIYAIASRDSKTSARQFVSYCRAIGAPLYGAGPEVTQLFDKSTVENVFEVEEPVFNVDYLRNWSLEEIERVGIELRTGVQVTSLNRSANGISVEATENEKLVRFRSPLVFNCCYSAMNKLNGGLIRTKTQLRHELAEIAVITMPDRLRSTGVTVMDGPFFSTLPFPSLDAHSLTHVRFTPHEAFDDDSSPSGPGSQHENYSRAEWMIRDAARYMPSLRDSRYITSLFEIKTILQRNEKDDGRPILFESCDALPGLHFVLGGKLDNVFDVFESIDKVAL